MTNSARMTVSEAVQILKDKGTNLNEKDAAFARDLYGRAVNFKPLSEKQQFWIAELAHKAAFPQANDNAKKVPVTVNADLVNEMFDNARSNGHTSPKIYFHNDHVGEVRLTVSKGGQYPHTVQITDRQGNWYGRILKDGTVHSRYTAKAHVDAVSDFCANPVDAVVKYGQKTGNCSFCARGLTDKESVARGYGPICADNYGLPYGN
jgi:Family of unknown function (DUF6011)